MLDYETATRHMKYDPDTGVLTRILVKGKPANRVMPGTRKGRDYPHTAIEGHRVQYHRLAWLLHHGSWPTTLLDHVNGDRGDNRMCNLRLVTAQQNTWNRGMMSNNSSGVRGVVWCNQKRRWRANIFKDGKSYHLGYHRELSQAEAARIEAEEKMFGEFSSRERVA